MRTKTGLILALSLLALPVGRSQAQTSLRSSWALERYTERIYRLYRSSATTARYKRFLGRRIKRLEKRSKRLARRLARRKARLKGLSTQGASSSPSGYSTQAQGVDPAFKLGDVYCFPNPAKRSNPTFHVEVGLADQVDLRIYDISGDRVHEISLSGTPPVIDDGQGPQYAYEYTWDVSSVGSGVYVYVMRAKKGSETLKRIGKCAVIR